MIYNFFKQFCIFLCYNSFHEETPFRYYLLGIMLLGLMVDFRLAACL